jgi:hypothetical protein
MPKRIHPQDQWEIDFFVPLPGEPRNIGPLETLFQRLLNRTERLKNRIAAILGLPWDATPPDTLAGLAGRVTTLENSQGGTTLAAHRNAPVLDHPDGSITLSKLAPAILGQPNGLPLLNSAGALAAGNAYLDRGYLNSAIDWDTITTAGVYRVGENAFGPGSANTPPISPSSYRHGVLLVFVSGITVQQIYIPHVTDSGMYFRQSWDPTYAWSQWFQAGYRSSSNSYGSYIRFADGTQICWGFGVANGPDPQMVIYPAAFVEPPAVVATTSDWPPLLISLDKEWGLGTTQQRFRKYNADGTPYTGPYSSFSYIAIGRWR